MTPKEDKGAGTVGLLSFKMTQIHDAKLDFKNENRAIFEFPYRTIFP